MLALLDYVGLSIIIDCYLVCVYFLSGRGMFMHYETV